MHTKETIFARPKKSDELELTGKLGGDELGKFYRNNTNSSIKFFVMFLLTFWLFPKGLSFGRSVRLPWKVRW